MATPTITSISPSGGSVAGGTTVTITGTNLTTPTAVAFGATPATSYAGLSATQAFAIAPAGTGTVDVTLTTSGGTSAASAGSGYTYGAVLFTIAEARAFDKLQLASTASFPTATITAKEAEIREWFVRVCGVDFISTTHTDEHHSGDGSQILALDWPRVTSITAGSTRSDATWTALSADELTDLHVDPDLTWYVYREGSYWPKGTRNLKVTYVAGYTTVPALVKRAALWVAIYELVTSNLSPAAETYDSGGESYSFNMGDGYGQNAWHRIPEVRKAIALYSHRPPGIA